MSRSFEVRWKGDLIVDDTWEDEYSEEVNWELRQPESKWEDAPDCFEKGSMKVCLGAPLFYGLPYELVDISEQLTAMDFTPTVSELTERLAKLQADPMPIMETLDQWLSINLSGTKVDLEPKAVTKAVGDIAEFVAY